MLVAAGTAMRCTLRVAAVVVVSSTAASAAPEEQACAYRLTPLTASVPGEGGTGQIAIATGAGCTWTVTTGTPWLSAAPSGGAGNGTVTFIAAANTLRTGRFGSLTIAGRAVFISQSPPSTTTTAPGAPRQLVASVSGSSITLSWSPPDAGGAPSTYVLAAGSASGWSNLASFATGSTLTTFSAIGVPHGTYFARVSAQNASGTSASSNEVSFSVAPSSCSAAPPSALQSMVSGSLVTLTWAAPTAGVAPTSYVVEAGTSASLIDLATVDTGSPATTFTANAPPGSYFVRVRAVTPCGVTTPTSDVVVVVQP